MSYISTQICDFLKTIGITITSLLHCNFVSLFPPLSCLFIRSLSLSLSSPFLSPLLSFSVFLFHSCVSLTPEMLSVLTGEAAGEMGWLECQAASMLKWGKKTHSSQLCLWRFCQVFWFPQETFVLKWDRIPPRERICTDKIALNCLLQFWWDFFTFKYV